MVLGVTSENLILDIFRPPLQFGSLCKSVKNFKLDNTAQRQKFAP